MIKIVTSLICAFIFLYLVSHNFHFGKRQFNIYFKSVYTGSYLENNCHISSIGSIIASMTSQNGGQDGRHGSKMAAMTPIQDGIDLSPVKGHDL